MSRTLRLATVAVAALLLLPMVPAPARAAGPTWHQWAGTATGVYRDGTYDRGEFIYSNGIFQSRGANADVPHRHRTDYFPGGAAPVYSPPNDLYRAYTYDFFGAHRSTYNGTYHLPTDTSRYPDFTADLSELRLAIEGPDLFVRVQFTSFPAPTAQVATLAFAADGAPGAARPWPRNAGVSSPWATALTLAGSGSSISTGSTSQDLVAAGGATRVSDHSFEARIPLALLPAGKWSITGGSGLADPLSPGQYWTVPAGAATATQPGTNSQLAPGANVWDLLFSRDDPWTFDELRQADDLRGGVVSGDRQVVDPALLRQGVTQPASIRTGDLSRYFASAIGSSDGIDRSAGIFPASPPPAVAALGQLEDFDVTYHYLGRLQPYYMHVPAAYPARADPSPLIVYLHGFTGLPDEPFYNPIGLVPMADQNGYLLASALGRGDYSYRGPGDVDVKEVIADVEKHYNVDRNRIYLMGHSMGGYGTNNVAIHNPDLFAAVAPAEGTDSISLHQNLRNLPWLEMTAEEDLDTFATNAKLLYGNLSADGYDSTLVDYKFKIHEYSSIYDTLDRIFAFFAAHRRNPDPPVVTYSRLPREDMPAIGLSYDHAYWVSGLRSAEAGKRSDTTVETLGISHGALNAGAATRTDVTGVEPGKTEVPRRVRELFQTTPAYGPAGAVTNAGILTLSNVSAVTLDLARMRLVDDCSLALSVKSDQPVAINIGRRTLSAPSGTSVLRGGGAACASTAAATGNGLPNTGGDLTHRFIAVAALLLAALAAAAGTRRRRRRA